MFDENDIYGDGVNIASRLEAMAEPGGICISEGALREIRGKVDIDCDDLGPQILKNITEPVRAWRGRVDAPGAGGGPALAGSEAPAAPREPSVAVLPVQVMTGEPQAVY